MSSKELDCVSILRDLKNRQVKMTQAAESLRDSETFLALERKLFINIQPAQLITINKK